MTLRLGKGQLNLVWRIFSHIVTSSSYQCSPPSLSEPGPALGRLRHCRNKDEDQSFPFSESLWSPWMCRGLGSFRTHTCVLVVCSHLSLCCGSAGITRKLSSLLGLNQLAVLRPLPHWDGQVCHCIPSVFPHIQWHSPLGKANIFIY